MATERELLLTLRRGLRVQPPLRAGIPKKVFNELIRRTAKWLLDGAPTDQLPLYTLDSLQQALRVADKSGRLRRSKRSAVDAPSRDRQIGETLQKALVSLTERLRAHPHAETEGQTLRVRFEANVGRDSYDVEISGLFIDNRRGLGFPEDDRIGLLARLTLRRVGNAGAESFRSSSNEVQTPSATGSLLPMCPTLLVGREAALHDLKERLFNPNPAIAGHVQVLAAIDGLPGVGKTSVAAALAHDPAIGEWFPDGVLWTALGKTPNVLWELSTWGRALAIPYILEVSSVHQASSLLAAALRDRRTLLIVDDVWSVEHAAPFRVGGRECATLISTRAPAMADALAAVPQQVYTLPVLTIEASRELLTALAPTVVREHSDAVDRLLRDLDGLPLAIQVAGRLLASESKYGFDVNQLLHELHNGQILLEALAPADYSDVMKETTPTVAALLRKSTDVLPPLVRERFAFLGAFAPKPARFDLAILRHLWGTGDPITTVRTLLDYGLIERIQETDQYQIHALIALHARSLAST